MNVQQWVQTLNVCFAAALLGGVSDETRRVLCGSFLHSHAGCPDILLDHHRSTLRRRHVCANVYLLEAVP
jgi:hypothetical protein